MAAWLGDTTLTRVGTFAGDTQKPKGHTGRPGWQAPGLATQASRAGGCPTEASLDKRMKKLHLCRSCAAVAGRVIDTDGAGHELSVMATPVQYIQVPDAVFVQPQKAVACILQPQRCGVPRLDKRAGFATVEGQ